MCNELKVAATVFDSITLMTVHFFTKSFIQDLIISLEFFINLFMCKKVFLKSEVQSKTSQIFLILQHYAIREPPIVKSFTHFTISQ